MDREWTSEWVDAEPGGTKGVSIDAEGVKWRRRRRVWSASWAQVFGVARMGDSLYLMAPRRPPNPPWIEIRKRDLGPEHADLDAFERAVDNRRRAHGYRDAPRTRNPLSTHELLERVLARREVPGALEVPIAHGPPSLSRIPRWVDYPVIGGMGAYAGAMLAPTLLEVGVSAGLALGAVPAAAAAGLLLARIFLLPKRRRGRVLVLTPDGCVVGLPSGPRAFAWSEISRFRSAQRTGEWRGQREMLEVVGNADLVHGSIDAAWFAKPLSLIVPVAEAYRKRASV